MPGPDKDKELHANRKHSLPYNNKQGKKSFSRKHHLFDDGGDNQIKTIAGHMQSGAALTDGTYDKADEAYYPQQWPKVGSPLKVPKVVILSAYLHWWEQWERSTFLYCNTGIGVSLCDPSKENNYTQIWQLVTKNGDKDFNQDDLKGEVNRQVCCTVDNPMMEMYLQLLDAFEEAKEILSQDKNPIYVMIPKWEPKYAPMKVMDFSEIKYVPTGRSPATPMLPMYDLVKVTEPYLAPDFDSQDAEMKFSFKGVPCLAAPEPGFGTDTLHMYFGQFCKTKEKSNNIYSFESYPYGPMGNYASGQFMPAYDFQAPPIPISPWHDCGFPYGYTAGGDNIAYYYKTTIQEAAEIYKKNFWEYRNFGVRFFEFDVDFKWQWNPGKIWDDQLMYDQNIFDLQHDCCSWSGPGPGHGWCWEDGWCVELPGFDGVIGITEAYASWRIPYSQTIRDGISNFFPAIKDRIEKYYRELSTGAKDFYNTLVEDNDLGKYNVKYANGASSFTSGAAIAQYVRDYFDEQDRLQKEKEEGG